MRKGEEMERDSLSKFTNFLFISLFNAKTPFLPLVSEIFLLQKGQKPAKNGHFCRLAISSLK